MIALSLLIIGLFVLLSRVNGTAQSDVPINSAGVSASEREIQEQATLAMLANLKAALSQSTGQFVIPPGTYRFDGEAGQDFKLTDVSGFKIEATGVTFCFNPRFGVRLRNCHQITIHGLTDPGYTPLVSERYRIVFFEGNTGRRLSMVDNSVSSSQDLGNGEVRLTKFNDPEAFLQKILPRQVAIGDHMTLLGGAVTGAILC